MAEMQYTRAYTDTTERGWADEKPGTAIPFVASTPGVKRDNLDLRASGWKTDNYSKSPVVLWCHDHRSLPLGTATTEILPDRLRMPVTFDQQDDFAVRVESKVRRKIIRACSVGWDFVDANGQPLDTRRMTLEDLRDRAFYDLTELSIVPVGADPQALSERRRTALRSLSRELAALYDDQERPDSDATGPDLAAAVRAEIDRIGINLGTVGEPGEFTAEPITAVVDERALARAIAAAFADLGIGARAAGGPVTSGGAYLVGETGCEFVLPASMSTTSATGGSITISAAAGGEHAPGEPHVKACRCTTPKWNHLTSDHEPPAGDREPCPTADTPTPDSAARAAKAIDQDAARDVLAAFNL